MAKPKQTTKEEIISSLPTCTDDELVSLDEALQKEIKARLEKSNATIGKFNKNGEK